MNGAPHDTLAPVVHHPKIMLGVLVEVLHFDRIAAALCFPRQCQAQSTRTSRDQNDSPIKGESTCKHTDDIDLRVAPIETGDFARGLAVDGAFFQISALVACDFAVGETELGFELSVLPIEFENDQSAPGDLRLAVKLRNLLSM